MTPAPCTHPTREGGRCLSCGDCAHDVILNGACLACGTTELAPMKKPPPPPPLVSIRKK